MEYDYLFTVVSAPAGSPVRAGETLTTYTVAQLLEVQTRHIFHSIDVCYATHLRAFSFGPISMLTGRQGHTFAVEREVLHG